MQVANAILAGVTLLYQEAMTLCIRVGSTLQILYFSSVICFVTSPVQ